MLALEVAQQMTQAHMDEIDVILGNKPEKLSDYGRTLNATI